MSYDAEILQMLRNISSKLDIISYKLDHMYFTDTDIPPYASIEQDPIMMRLRKMDDDDSLEQAMKAMNESMKWMQEKLKPKSDSE